MIYEGVLKRMARQFWPDTDTRKKLEFDAIEIKQVIQIHILLLSGYLVATLFLMIEAMLAKRRKQKRRLRIIQAVPIYNHLELWQ